MVDRMVRGYTFYHIVRLCVADVYGMMRLLLAGAMQFVHG